MSKFNKLNILVKSQKKVLNLAGGQAFKQSDKEQFASILLTSFLRDRFYETEKETIARIRDLMTKVDPLFAAKTAVYARREFGMRSVSHFVASEIAKNVKGAEWTGDFFERIVRRPDDITEILACYMSAYGKPIPNSLKRGLGRALSKLDELALAKYKQNGAALSMVDAVNLLHPMHTKALRKLVKGTLPAADTWETIITQVGQNNDTEEDKSDAKGEGWGNLVKEKKLGYMALIRNLRNILTYAPNVIDEVCDQLRNKVAIKKSLMFPFRFLTAIEVVKGILEVSYIESRKVMNALSDAIEISLDNVPVFEGNTLVVLDSSGSMTGKPAEIGSLFSATLLKSNNADFILFSNNAKYVNVNTRDSLVTIAKSIPFLDGGTNFQSIFQTANKKYDRIILLSDMASWLGDTILGYRSYCSKYSANPKLYTFDLNGYGSLQFPEKNVYCFAGFSDKVFDIMGMLERDKDALVNVIEAVEFNE